MTDTSLAEAQAPAVTSTTRFQAAGVKAACWPVDPSGVASMERRVEGLCPHNRPHHQVEGGPVGSMPCRPGLRGKKGHQEPASPPEG